MIIEICSREKAFEEMARAETETAVISIVSTDEKDIILPEGANAGPVLRLRFNDLTEEYDEEGISYGRPLPKPEDFAGLKAFTDGLSCGRLLVHCWEGVSRSAAVAAAVYRARGCRDTLLTHQRFAPNPLVFTLACRELGVRETYPDWTIRPGGGIIESNTKEGLRDPKTGGMRC